MKQHRRPVPRRPQKSAAPRPKLSIPDVVVDQPNAVQFVLQRIVRLAVPPLIGNPTMTELKRNTFLDGLYVRLREGKTLRQAFDIDVPEEAIPEIELLFEQLASEVQDHQNRRRYWEEAVYAMEYPPLSQEQVEAIVGRSIYLLSVEDDGYYPVRIREVRDGITVLGEVFDTFGVPIEEDVIAAPYWATMEFTPDEYFAIVRIPLPDVARNQKGHEKPPTRAHNKVLKSWTVNIEAPKQKAVPAQPVKATPAKLKPKVPLKVPPKPKGPPKLKLRRK